MAITTSHCILQFSYILVQAKHVYISLRSSNRDNLFVEKEAKQMRTYIYPLEVLKFRKSRVTSLASKQPNVLLKCQGKVKWSKSSKLKLLLNESMS
eukprot:1565848-Amphidinium_carterae.1